MFKSEKGTLRLIGRQSMSESDLVAIRAAEIAAQHLLGVELCPSGKLSYEDWDNYRAIIKHYRVAATPPQTTPALKIRSRQVKISGEVIDSVGRNFKLVAWITIVSNFDLFGTGQHWTLMPDGDHFIRVGSYHPGKIIFNPGTLVHSVAKVDQSPASRAAEVDYSDL